ncbi:hypothetical protein M422DRAFT_40112, partial [Sphaerobolus stellatus SS14]
SLTTASAVVFRTKLFLQLGSANVVEAEYRELSSKLIVTILAGVSYLLALLVRHVLNKVCFKQRRSTDRYQASFFTNLVHGILCIPLLYLTLSDIFLMGIFKCDLEMCYDFLRSVDEDTFLSRSLFYWISVHLALLPFFEELTARFLPPQTTYNVGTSTEVVAASEKLSESNGKPKDAMAQSSC